MIDSAEVMGAATSQIIPVAACAQDNLPVCRDGNCTTFGDVPPEYLDPDSAACDGDVRDSPALTNHKLLKAASEGNVEKIARMLERSGYIETRRPFVMTPESAATHDGALTTRGTGLTPLMYAAQGGYDLACLALLEAGACVNAEDEDGLRPLHFGAFSGNDATCSVLLEGGAEPNALDDEGRLAIEHVPDISSRYDRRRWEILLRTPMPDRSKTEACRSSGAQGEIGTETLFEAVMMEARVDAPAAPPKAPSLVVGPTGPTAEAEAEELKPLVLTEKIEKVGASFMD